MPNPPSTTGAHWGAARVAVLTLRTEIERDLAVGTPVSEIYRRHKDRLSNITPGAFTRQVRLLLKADKQPKTPQPQDAEPINARHKPASSGAYYEPPQNDAATRERLIGPKKS
jgi:hypothetical protein